VLNSSYQKEMAIFDINDHLKKMRTDEAKELCKQIFTRFGVNYAHVNWENLVLDWEDIREMNDNGVVFGAHTMTYPNLARIPFQEAHGEIVRSKELIERNFGSNVSFLLSRLSIYKLIEIQDREAV